MSDIQSDLFSCFRGACEQRPVAPWTPLRPMGRLTGSHIKRLFPAHSELGRKGRVMKAFSVALAILLVGSHGAAETRSNLDESMQTSHFDASTSREQATKTNSSALHPGNRVLGSADFAARVGPVGMAARAGLVLHHTYEVDVSGDYEMSYLEGGLAIVATPATLEPQAHFEYLPVPFLLLRGELAAVHYLGTNYGLLNFESRNADFSGAALSARKGDEQKAWGVRGGLSVTPRVKVGPVLLRSKLSITAYRFDQPGPYVYDADLDTLLGTTDLVFASRSDLLFELHDGPGAETLLLGPSVEVTRTVDSALSRARVGAVLWYVPTERWGNLYQPRLYAQAGINASDPNRSGEPFSSGGFGADFY